MMTCLLGLSLANAAPNGTNFSYQGQLNQNGELAQGAYDFEFFIYDVDTGGIALTAPLSLEDVQVTEGVFSVDLDFGPSPYSGVKLWLEIRVRDGSSVGSFTGLAPRQVLNPTPFAIRAQSVDVDSIASAEIEDGTVGSADLAAGAVGTSQINSDEVQRRVSGSCSVGSYIRSISEDGTVICEAAAGAEYSAGNGIVLIDTTFSADTSVVQQRITSSCSTGSSIRSIDENGGVICQPDSDTDTTYSAGSGVILTDTTFSVDPAAVQTRVSSSCGAGQYLTGINEDGSPLCADLNLPLDYAENPLVLSGISTHSAPTDGSSNFSFVLYPRHFNAKPIVVATNDESLDGSGASGIRTRRETRSRAGFRLNGTTDAIHWFAIDPGSHTIDGKAVMAGKFPNAVNNSSISYPQAFQSAPAVFLTLDETGNNSGGFFARLIGSPATGGFQIWVDAPADAINWVAMEPGDYTHGRYFWRAGILTPSSCTNPCTHSFGTPLQGTPTVLLQIRDTNNSGASWVRISNVTDSGFDYRLSGSGTETVYFLAVVELH